MIQIKGANELKYDTAIPTTGIAVNFDTEVMLKIETYGSGILFVM